jgi:triacylglycerol lipase
MSIGHAGQKTSKRPGNVFMALAKFATTIVAALILTAAAGAEGPMPDDIAWKLIEMGRTIDPPRTAALYAPLQRKEPYSGVRVERDVKYGPAELNRLDIFAPETAPENRPVLLFLRGGAFTTGDKRLPGSPFYDNIMLWAVTNGFVGVNLNYRLAPQSPWPAGGEDIASAIQWVIDNIGARGGDPARIYLMGHSAGAVHVATYVAHPEFHRLKDGGLKGAIMVSGIYDLTATPLADPEKAYFGSDPARYAERSSLDGLKTTKIPFMIVAAELDPPGFNKQFDLLKEARCKAESGCVRALLLPQHNHMSEVYSINTQDTRLTDQILNFVKSGK